MYQPYIEFLENQSMHTVQWPAQEKCSKNESYHSYYLYASGILMILKNDLLSSICVNIVT